MASAGCDAINALPDLNVIGGPVSQAFGPFDLDVSIDPDVVGDFYGVRVSGVIDGGDPFQFMLVRFNGITAGTAQAVIPNVSAEAGDPFGDPVTIQIDARADNLTFDFFCEPTVGAGAGGGGAADDAAIASGRNRTALAAINSMRLSTSAAGLPNVRRPPKAKLEDIKIKKVVDNAQPITVVSLLAVPSVADGPAALVVRFVEGDAQSGLGNEKTSGSGLIIAIDAAGSNGQSQRTSDVETPFVCSEGGQCVSQITDAGVATGAVVAPATRGSDPTILSVVLPVGTVPEGDGLFSVSLVDAVDEALPLAVVQVGDRVSPVAVGNAIRAAQGDSGPPVLPPVVDVSQGNSQSGASEANGFGLFADQRRGAPTLSEHDPDISLRA